VQPEAGMRRVGAIVRTGLYTLKSIWMQQPAFYRVCNILNALWRKPKFIGQ